MAKEDDSSKAAQKVFAIPELLIPIISYLPPRIIISAASTVSKQWRFIIIETLEIQEKLLLKTRHEPLRPDRIDVVQVGAAGVAMRIPCYDEALEISDFVSLKLGDVKIAGSKGLDIEWSSYADLDSDLASMHITEAQTRIDFRRRSSWAGPIVHMQRNPFFLHDIPASKTHDSIGIRFDLNQSRSLSMPLSLPLHALKTAKGLGDSCS